MATIHTGFVSWAPAKAAPMSLTGTQWSGSSYIDLYKRQREPTPNELMLELKNTAWCCATGNAAVCANYYPRLFVATGHADPDPKCLTARLSRKTEDWLRSRKDFPARWTKAAKLQEVMDHPILRLIQRPNPVHNQFDLWELTTLYQEVQGCAYWKLDIGPLGIPEAIWILPAQNVTPKREPNSPNLVDYYDYRNGSHSQRFAPEEVIHFRYPDPRDPYTAGYSPLRACYEQAQLASHYTARRTSVMENTATPDAIIAAADVMGPDERDRLEAQWNQRFRRGGAGRALVSENPLTVTLLREQLGDLSQLAENMHTKEDICNAFHFPIAFMTGNTNMANIQAAHSQHMQLAISPRLSRRDEKLNERLIPYYDPSGRLFLASEDPVPVNLENEVTKRDLDMKYGVVSINEVRQERGLAPVPWGNVPWLPLQWERVDFQRRADEAPDTGRNHQPPRYTNDDRQTTDSTEDTAS